MKSLALRLTLLGVFVAAAAGAVYFSWTSRTHGYRDAGQAASFDESSVGAERDVLELRAAQEGYVAAGQEDQFWASKVDATTARLHDTLTTLRAKATAPDAQTAIDNASSALQDFEQMDRRARDHARSGQKLLASDLIFTDGIELAGAATGAVEDARLAERRHRAAALAALDRQEIAAAAAALAVGLITVGLLVPRTDDSAAVPDITARTAPRIDPPAARLDGGPGIDEGWTAAKVMPRARPAARAAATPAVKAPATAASSTKPTAVEAPAAAPAAALAAPTVDLPGVASLCSDLARVVDTQALPSLLARAAAVLDAPGIVLWIADPDGRELSPVVTHGYPQQLVSRLGTIGRDAENATASAFRTALLQTVKADAVSNGAIAAPLVTPAGCVGVMAAEVRQAGEEDAGKLAIAAIVAAQLATLVGPPSARAQARVEAAGA
ncbi:MAG: hypothetical protein ABI603_14500 [Acidobacteriota bacterium]